MARSRTQAKAARSKSKAARPGVDLEAIGLVLLAFGLSFGGLLVPALPTGELGRLVQEAVAGRVGWGAYALPLPFVVLGAAFLLRRNPPRWPRVSAGYLLTCLGLWSLLMLIAPAQAGRWGESARATLAGASGALAYAPALLVVTLGVEVVMGWRPTRLVRAAAVAAMQGLRRFGRWAWRVRREVRASAALRADGARLRRALRDIDRDLAVLEERYPGSAEVARWREHLTRTDATLRRPERDALDAAESDVGVWRETVATFTRDRAAELAPALRAEGLQEFPEWVRQRNDDLSEPVPPSGEGARALDEVRQGLALELAALADRYRRCARERDAAEAALDGVDVAGLAAALDAHALRVRIYRDVAEAAGTVEADAGRLEAWRGLVGRAARLATEFPAYEELREYDASVADDLRRKGREALSRLEGWEEALDAVELRARQEARARAGADAAVGAAEPPPPEAELLGDEDLPAHVEPAASSEPEAAAAAGGDEPPFEPDGGIDAPDADPGRGADDDEAEDPAVGGIPIRVPSLTLLEDAGAPGGDPEEQAREVQARVQRIDETLANFKLRGRVVSSVRGPTVTRFEVEPAPGEKISRFANLADDLALAMAASSVRIEAPIPGKSVIGLEVPNSDRDLLRFREAAESPAFRRTRARLPLILGKSIEGELIVGDLAKMPHLLIAGSTGSGKSVAVNTFVASLVFKYLPTEMRMLMIDPKMVELTPFDGIPHLIRPVVTNPNDAAGVLLGAVEHMERRYKMMSRVGAKNLDQYNEKARNLDLPQLPFLTIVIDELADLMITSPKEVESAIMRLAQMARATGMHLVLATQRPSVDILTSLIKVNVPARVAFAVSSSHDSRTILDTMGAERLVGLGDMLFYQPGMSKPARLQGPYVSENEIGTIASYLRRQYFDDEFVEAYGDDFEPVSADDSDASGLVDWNDDKLRQAAEMVVRDGQASVSRLQRRMQVGHARAGKLMDSLEALGVVGAHTGSKPREVLVAFEELPDVFGR